MLLIGSPKNGASTSEVLGGYLLKCLEETGWSTKTLKLRPRVFTTEGLKELFSLVDQADLIVRDLTREDRLRDMERNFQRNFSRLTGQNSVIAKGLGKLPLTSLWPRDYSIRNSDTR